MFTLLTWNEFWEPDVPAVELLGAAAPLGFPAEALPAAPAFVLEALEAVAGWPITSTSCPT